MFLPALSQCHHWDIAYSSHRWSGVNTLNGMTEVNTFILSFEGMLSDISSMQIILQHILQYCNKYESLGVTQKGF